MTNEEMLAEILTRLEEMNAQLHSINEPSPSSTSIPTADTEDQEASADPVVLIASTDADPSERIPFSLTAVCHTARWDPLPSDHRDACGNKLWCAPGHIIKEFQMEQYVPRYPFAFAAGGVGFGDLNSHALAVHSASASPTLSTTSAPSQDEDLGFQMVVTELLATLPTRCSTLAPYQAACTPVSIAPSLAQSTAFPASTLAQEVVLVIPIVATMTATMSDSSLGIERYLGPYSLQVGCAALRHKATDHAKLSHDAIRKAGKILLISNDIGNGQGCRQPKPPWLLGTEVFRSWFGKLQLICGFLLEVSSWCRDSTVWVQWQLSMTPPAQLGVPGNDMLSSWPSISQNHARVQIATVNCVWIVWCFPSEHVSVDYLLAQFGMHLLNWLPELFVNLVAAYSQCAMMTLNMQRKITMDWSSSSWHMSLYWDIQMGQMQNEDMILAHEKQCQNEKMVLCLKPWTLHGHMLVTDQKVELRSWPSFSCYPTKACVDTLSCFEVSADSKYHKREHWLNIHPICVLLTRVAGCWHFLLVLLSLKWSAQLLDLIAVQEQKALYMQTWMIIYELDWCPIHSMNLNQICFSEIQQLVGFHCKEIRSELHGNGMTPPVQLKKVSRELVDTKEDVRVALLLMPLWTSPTISELWPPCVSGILSSSEQATHIQCGAKTSTIRLAVFLLQPWWWYKNSNRCCITDSSNYQSSWVLVQCQNIASEIISFLNASMPQILLQDNEARVQGSQSGQYLCYLKQLNDD